MSSVDIDGVHIAAWTMVVIRRGAFIHQLSFCDENGVPTVPPLLDAKIVVTPNGSAEIEWTQANGRFTVVSGSVYLLALDEAYTESLLWSAGSWRAEIVESSGITVPCVTEGLIFVKDC
jgi:hypothetical protein